MFLKLAAGIGTVQSLHNVTLRPQVSGIVTEVLFEEGQNVKRGQLLARIDDRTILANLRQAEAEKARNEAQLKAANLDKSRYDNLLAEEAISRQTVEQQVAMVEQLASGDSRQRSDHRGSTGAAVLHEDHFAGERPRRSASCRSGQPGPARRCRRPGDRHAGRSHLRHLHVAAGIVGSGGRA